MSASGRWRRHHQHRHQPDPACGSEQPCVRGNEERAGDGDPLSRAGVEAEGHRGELHGAWRHRDRFLRRCCARRCICEPIRGTAHGDGTYGVPPRHRQGRGNPAGRKWSLDHRPAHAWAWKLGVMRPEADIWNTPNISSRFPVMRGICLLLGTGGRSHHPRLRSLGRLLQRRTYCLGAAATSRRRLLQSARPGRAVGLDGTLVKTQRIAKVTQVTRQKAYTASPVLIPKPSPPCRNC